MAGLRGLASGNPVNVPGRAGMSGGAGSNLGGGALFIEGSVVPESPNILVLEDEAFTAVDLALTLQQAGFAVQGPYLSPDLAVDALRRQRPDVAILDIRLSGGDTSESVATMLERMGVPIVFLTGEPDPARVLTREFSRAYLVSKPVENHFLVKAVRKMLKLYSDTPLGPDVASIAL